MKMNTHSLFGGFAPGVFALSLSPHRSRIHCLAAYAHPIFFFAHKPGPSYKGPHEVVFLSLILHFIDHMYVSLKSAGLVLVVVDVQNRGPPYGGIKKWGVRNHKGTAKQCQNFRVLLKSARLIFAPLPPGTIFFT